MDSKGNLRYTEVWVKNGKRSYKFVDDQRKAKPITYAEAKKHFEKLPEKRQKADKQYKAKNTFEKDEITTKYLSKSGTSRFDVEDLDTPLEEWSKDWDKAEKIQKEYEKAPKKEIEKNTETDVKKRRENTLKELEKLNLNDDWKSIHEDAYGGEGYMLSKMALITTNESFKEMNISNAVKDAYEVNINNSEYVISHDLIKFGENSYNKTILDDAFKKMDNPKIYYEKDKPLTIKDDNYTMILSPRAEKGWMGQDDSLPETGVVKIPYTEYKEISKSMTKKELLTKINQLDPEKKYKKEEYKDNLICDYYDLMKSEKKTTKPKKEIHQKPFLPELKEKEKYYIVSVSKEGYIHYQGYTTKPEKAMKDFEDTKQFFKIHHIDKKVELFTAKDLKEIKYRVDKRKRVTYDNFKVSGKTYVHKGMLKRYGLKWDYNDQSWRGKLSPEEITAIQKYSDLKVDSDKEYTKKEKSSSIETGTKKRTERLRIQDEKYKDWENKYRPFTPAQVSYHNTYTHWPEDINDKYEDRIRSREDKLKHNLDITEMNNAPIEVKISFNRYKKELYEYYIARSRARAKAPPTSVVGRSNYKGNPQKATQIERKAIERLEKADKNLGRDVYKITKPKKSAEELRQERREEITPKLIEAKTKEKKVFSPLYREWYNVEKVNKKTITVQAKTGDYSFTIDKDFITEIEK